MWRITGVIGCYLPDSFGLPIGFCVPLEGDIVVKVLGRLARRLVYLPLAGGHRRILDTVFEHLLDPLGSCS